MATAYSFNAMGQFRQGTNQGQAGQYSDNNINCAPAKEPRPRYIDIPFFMEGIARGNNKALELLGTRVLMDANQAEPREFVFTGSANLWLMPHSNIGGISLVSQPTPLDTFRLGGPNKVSWPSITVYAAIVMIVENRCPARNAPAGQFIARLSCVAGPEPMPF